LNKIDNGFSIKPKRLISRMFSSILAVLFLSDYSISPTSMLLKCFC